MQILHQDGFLLYQYRHSDMLLYIMDLKKRGALVTRCEFPQHYTGLHNESWPEEGGALQAGCACLNAKDTVIPQAMGDTVRWWETHTISHNPSYSDCGIKQINLNCTMHQNYCNTGQILLTLIHSPSSIWGGVSDIILSDQSRVGFGTNFSLPTYKTGSNRRNCPST